MSFTADVAAATNQNQTLQDLQDAALEQEQQEIDHRLLNRLHYLLSDYHNLPTNHTYIRQQVQKYLDYGFNSAVLVSAEQGWKLVSQKLYKDLRVQFFDEYFPYCEQARERSVRIEKDFQQDQKREKMKQHLFQMELEEVSNALREIAEEEKRESEKEKGNGNNNNTTNSAPQIEKQQEKIGNTVADPIGSDQQEEKELMKQKRKEELSSRQMDLLLERQREIFSKRNALLKPGAVVQSCVTGPVSALDAV